LIDIGKTLRGNDILLTGGNGFVGKVLLGLILDRYPEFRHLHILLRPRRNLSASERFLEETLRSPALEKIAKKYGKDLLQSKITIWDGDVAQPNCGLLLELLVKMADAQIPYPVQPQHPWTVASRTGLALGLPLRRISMVRAYGSAPFLLVFALTSPELQSSKAPCRHQLAP